MPIRYALIIVLITIMTCSVVWVRLKIVNLGYQIHDLEKKDRDLRNELSQLTYKLNEARSPQHLEPLARKKFAMHPPETKQIISLRR